MSHAASTIESSPDVTPRASYLAARGVPAIAALVIGQLVGPAGLSVVTNQLLSLVDAFIPLALSTMGVLAGLQVNIQGQKRGIAAGALVGGIVSMVVAAGVRGALSLVSGPEESTRWWIAIAVGLCARCAVPLLDDDSRGEEGSETRHLGLVLPFVAGSFVFAAAHTHAFPSAAFLLGASILAAALIAVSGSLLTASWSTAAEHRVVGVAMVLLLGGIADLLSVVALPLGMCAGVIWRAQRSAAREALLPILDSLDRVFVIMIFLVAGAQSRVTLAAAIGAVAYGVCLVAARSIAVRIAAHSGTAVVSNLGVVLPASPYAVALAVGMSRGDVPGSTTILTVVVLATVGSHLIRWFSSEGDA